jgi:large subunit ribosomal protein L25
METFELTAQLRTDTGKAASRRLRRTGFIPAIVYGAEKPPVPLTLNHGEVYKNLLDDRFFSHILSIKINDQTESVVIKEVQRHPWRPFVMHLDLQRVSETEILYKEVPLHFINEEKSVGVKQGGGVISHHLNQIEIRCLPKDLPEFILVDVTELQLNETIHLSNLVLPQGVEIVALTHGGPEHDLPVVSIHPPKGHVEEEDNQEQQS